MSPIVIVAVGEVSEKPDDVMLSREPLQLMVDATKAVEEDAGARIIHAIDHIDVVKSASIPYPSLPNQLAEKLGLPSVRTVLSDGSGNGPMREMNNAALRIQRGESSVALLVGAEAQWSTDQAKKAKLTPPWMPASGTVDLFVAREFANPLALKYGLVIPAQVYPLYENGVTAKWGQTPAEARAESAKIWSIMSQVAQSNPHAWMKRPLSPQEIATPTPANRLLSWPYVKFMVALPSVNMGAAVIMMTVEKARQLGIAEDRYVYFEGGAAAREPDDYIIRDRYDANASQTAVIKGILELKGWETSQFDEVELYSCYPVVPKMTRRLLGLSADTPLTTAGGLTFFGAPLHNYMTHATVAMTRKLRGAKAGTSGLLYGQGGFVTKHHALALNATAPGKPLSETFSVQDKADALRGPIPELVDDYTGAATIETFTVDYDRDGQPARGALVLRTPEGRRALARVPAEDKDTIAFLTSLDASPIGASGTSRRAKDGLNEWATG